MHNLCLKPLGQVGFLLETKDLNIYIDPYLSNSVEEIEDKSIKRMIKIPIDPSTINNADYVLITHEHRDHCDEQTLKPIYDCSSKCIFIGPEPVVEKLLKLDFDESRLRTITSKIVLNDRVTVNLVPSAHPEINLSKNGCPKEVGYIVDVGDVRLYHAGDTSLRTEVISSVSKFKDIDIAMLPVNEINYMRNQKGIIGNMSVREAFYFANKLNLKTLIPTHWDMFADNQVFKEEIELLYRKLDTNFDLLIGENCYL